ncbi:hypothetical protein [Demequina salsinemoris]|uniref:hypothetical protein n=1 Tax=Demequina salsinemoris TaxID=577470 RepID=UPI0007809B7D|nr:hypothetical protein [Demequina salsinemoris]
MWALVVLGLVAVVVVAGLPFLVFPAHDEPGQVDVVLVLGGPTDARVDLAMQMVDDGLTENVLISLDPEQSENYRAAADACASRPEVVQCLKPDPFTTRGEVMWLSRESEANGWESAAVITFGPHISRARLIVNQCFGGDVLMLNSEEKVSLPYYAYMYAYQSAATVKALIQGRCE